MVSHIDIIERFKEFNISDYKLEKYNDRTYVVARLNEEFVSHIKSFLTDPVLKQTSEGYPEKSDEFTWGSWELEIYRLKKTKKIDILILGSLINDIEHLTDGYCETFEGDEDWQHNDNLVTIESLLDKFKEKRKPLSDIVIKTDSLIRNVSYMLNEVNSIEIIVELDNSDNDIIWIRYDTLDY
jgi:hypothetical protein